MRGPHLGIKLAIALTFVVAPTVHGQDAPGRPAGTRTTDPAIKRLAELVERAKKLHPQRQAARARRAARKAYEAASSLTEGRFRAAVQEELWKLGGIGYRAGDLRMAHAC